MSSIQNVKVEISLRTILLIAGLILLTILIWNLRIVFVILFLAFIVNSSIRPYVDYMEERRVPRMITIAFFLVILFAILSLATVTIVTDTFSQLKILATELPVIITNIITGMIDIFPWMADVVDTNELQNTIIQDFGNFDFIFRSGINSAYTVINSVLTAIVGAFTIIFIAVYMLARKDEVYSSVMAALPIKDRGLYVDLIKKIESKLGSWLRAQFVLMLIVGFMTWLGITIPAFFSDTYTLHEFALPIAFMAGLLEAIPNIGPFFTGVFAVLIAAGSGSPFIVLVYVAVLFTAIQQFEGIYIVPKVMQRVIGLDPIVTIVSIIGAYLLFGVFGALLIVPVIAVGQIIIDFQLNEVSHSKGAKK